MESNLDEEFNIAYEKISRLNEVIATDVLLKLYAYNKQANFGNNFTFQDTQSLISGFKFNAWMQLNGMSPEEAKKEYIKLANTIINSKK